MASDIALAVVGKIVEKTVDPVVNTIVRQFSYIFCYKRNIQALGDELALLEARRDGVRLSTAEAERNLEIVDPTVKLWLTKVDDIKSKAMEVHEGNSTVEKGCLNGWCPNLKHRYLLSRKATKLTASIGKLKGEGAKDAKFSHSACPIGIVPSEVPSIAPNDDGFKGFASRIATMNELMDALMDDDINLIGISGMGGVGKTTLVKQVLEKVKAESLFNEVAMTVVSQQQNLVKIQGEIAGMLGLKFTDGSIDARAERLCERLEKGGRVLVVLDDVWERINLREVGIPAGKGCKIVFTTRIERACIEMAAQRHIMVQILSHEEAWDLFREAAGDCVENADLGDIAKEVAKQCGGLPIAVVTIGKALSRREKYEWEDTMLQLKKSSGMDERVRSSIMLSYNFLERRRPNAQPLLLLCSLFEEDENIPVEQLVKYSMGLELFDDVETLEETRNRVHSLLNNLKSCNLLLQGDADDDLCVKLHDVVRDVCLLIASNPQHAYLVRHDLKLKRWPEHNRERAHTAISLTSGSIKELPAGLDYPNLRLLQLQLKHKNLKIAEDFFQGMRGLQVFNFQGPSDRYVWRPNFRLPPTLRLLTNLQTLSLEYCNLGGDISSIGCLKGLKILSFFKSKLDEFPREVGQLQNLRLLDSRCEDITIYLQMNGDFASIRLNDIESSLLSRLDQLEVLYMGKYLLSSINELNSMSSLTALQIRVSNSTILLELEQSFFDKLTNFDVSIGSKSHSRKQYGIISNNISQADDNLSWLSHTKLRSLVRKIRSFWLEGGEEDRFICPETDMDSVCSAFYNLESLAIGRMINLVEIGVDSKTPDIGWFHRLQELRVFNLPALKHLWRCPAQPPFLSNLRSLCIIMCRSIKSLFSPSVAKCMVQLEELSISHCQGLKGVISNQGKEDDKGFEKLRFPKLKSIFLLELDCFRSFYPESGNENLDVECDTFQSLFNQRVGNVLFFSSLHTYNMHVRSVRGECLIKAILQVTFPSLEEMEINKMDSLDRIEGYEMQEGPSDNIRSIRVSGCEKLKNFVASTMLKGLEDVDIKFCASMEAVFDLEGLKVEGEDSRFIFDKLASIVLVNLDKLAHVWRISPDGIQGFRNLTTLKLAGCSVLRYLMSFPVAKMLVNLQLIKLKYCPQTLCVIGEDKECWSEAKSEERVVFPQLQVLVLNQLRSVRSFCSSKYYSFEFPLLRKVKICGCPEMKIFCGGAVIAPLLKEPVEDPNGEQWIWEGNLNNGVYRGRREEKKQDIR